MPIKKVRYYIFLRDVFILSISAFGGPQAHLALFFDLFVVKRAYLTEEELLELYALCQVLPGPTSTQTITALGFRIGGPTLAYLTLLIWALPAVTIMTALAMIFTWMQAFDISLNFARFIAPMAIAFVSYSAYVISSKVIRTRLAFALMIVSALLSYEFNNPYVLPALLLAGGVIASFKYKQQPESDDVAKLNINWANFILFISVPAVAAVLGAATGWLPVRLFENFYRNGSLIFGGGQVLIPLLFNEFVEFKHYLTSHEFLSGYGIAQAVPGPVFSFASFIGSLSMRQYGMPGELLGALVAAAAIFLPGTFLIFFVIRFWDEAKKYRVVRASLEGVNAVSAGLVISAAVILMGPLEKDPVNITVMLLTVVLLFTKKIPAPYIILAGLLGGIVWEQFF